MRRKEKAYAKINLSLKVLNKRDDGFHNLDMLMVNISLYDILYFKKAKDIKVSMNKDVCEMEDNIVYKTALLLKNKYNVSDGIDIYIKKNIPDGGGLGGGSSDAATTLLVLNEMWNLNLSIEELSDIAACLGSDICFFLYKHIARVGSKGEIVETLDKRLDEDIALIIPDVKCNTKKVFQNHVIEESDKSIDELINNLDGDYYKYIFNDLEDTSKRVYEEYKLDEIKENAYKTGFDAVLMSGSGSTVFALSKQAFKQKIKTLKKLYPQYLIIACKTISSCK
jgi:4-diphosphocytidyl-2C-methyl-D-erythritol kinase